MKELSEIMSILNFLGLGGVGFFIFYFIKGLNQRISTLTALAEEQKKALEAARDRATEIEKLNKSYKESLDNFNDMGKKLEERRQELLQEIEIDNRQKQQELAKFKKLELEEIELKQKSYEKLPELEKSLENTLNELRTHVKILQIENLFRNQHENIEDISSTIIGKGCYIHIGPGYSFSTDPFPLRLKEYMVFAGPSALEEIRTNKKDESDDKSNDK